MFGSVGREGMGVQGEEVSKRLYGNTLGAVEVPDHCAVEKVLKGVLPRGAKGARGVDSVSRETFHPPVFNPSIE